MIFPNQGDPSMKNSFFLTPFKNSLALIKSFSFASAGTLPLSVILGTLVANVSAQATQNGQSLWSKKDFSVSSLSGLKAQKSLALTEAQQQLQWKKIELKSTPEDLVFQNRHELNENSLIVGFPLSFLKQEFIFGGVVIDVSVKEDPNLGFLKLADLTPYNITFEKVAATAESSQALALRGCERLCDENADLRTLFKIPSLGVDSLNKKVLLDLSAFGSQLNLVSQTDFSSEVLRWEPASSRTVNFDFSHDTLVFDVVTLFKARSETDAIKEFSVTARWYLKLNTPQNGYFSQRAPRAEVGFFTTSRALESKIQRFPLPRPGQKIHYYFKDIPKEFLPAFVSAIEGWNKLFRSTAGRDVLSYDVLEKNDPRYHQILAGDIRYNVLEWDLKHQAPYGGYGPSIANQTTGEILSANTLIQGPRIVELYTRWFALSKDIRQLEKQGNHTAAAKLQKQFIQQISKLTPQTYFKLTSGTQAWNIPTQRPELLDPLVKNHFEIVPEGQTYETYMQGYFHEMVAHELGHNLGLRHNFKGSLGSDNSRTVGSVSRSIMEYLGRPFRYLNDIGAYDEMAVSYGYHGKLPEQANWFCTDENIPSGPMDILFKSPECSRDDATPDPFSFFERRLSRAIDLVIAPQTTQAPVWTVKEIFTELEGVMLGIQAYAGTTESSTEWTNFNQAGNRPTEANAIRTYVLRSLKAKICTKTLDESVSAKETPEAVTVAQTNLQELRRFLTRSTHLEVFTEEELQCEQTAIELATN
jgi:hypothetical protein